MDKIILVDYGIFLHKAIFSYAKNKENGQCPPPEYTCLSMIIAHLNKVGINKERDRVIIAVDSKYGSWRKDAEKAYKGNRKAHRNKYDVDWKDCYRRLNKLLVQLDESTPFQVILLKKLEADDIIAYATEYYKDRECIIISFDADYEQLLTRDNVKIYSPHPACKKCPYKILHIDREKEKLKAFKSLAGKIKKETSDNLVTEVNTEEDYNKRKMIVSLLDLPSFVTERIHKSLDNINWNKEYDESFIPFDSLKDRYHKIFTEKGIITYEKCLNIKIKKLEKTQKKGGKKNETGSDWTN